MSSAVTQLKLRQNPLSLGPNFDRAPSTLRSAIERQVGAAARIFSYAMANNYVTISGKAIGEDVAWNLQKYSDTFGVDIIKLFRTITRLNATALRPAVLDGGTGLGVAIREIKKEFGDSVDCVGMDIIRFNHRALGEDLPEVPIVVGMLESLPFIDNCLFDMVLAHRSIYNSRAPFSILDEVIRVLRPGGVGLLEFSFSRHFIPMDHFYQTGFHKILGDLAGSARRDVPYFIRLPKVNWDDASFRIAVSFRKPDVNVGGEFFREFAARAGVPLYFGLTA